MTQTNYESITLDIFDKKTKSALLAIFKNIVFKMYMSAGSFLLSN